MHIRAMMGADGRLAARILLFACILLASLVHGRAHARQDTLQQPPGSSDKTVLAGVYVSPPFVMREGDHYTGMAIELWQELATRSGIDTRYKAYPSPAALAEAVATGEVDVAVTNLTVTQERTARLDFTQPWYDAGLRILISADAGGGFNSVLKGLYRSGHLQIYLLLFVLAIATTLVLTLFDRRFDPEFPELWRDGLAKSFYHVMAIATGRSSSRKNLFGWVGTVWRALWLLCGVALIAYVTSSVTSVMTTLSLTGRIESVDDLSGRVVGVLSESTGESYGRAHGFNIRGYGDLDAAVAAIHNGEANALIADAPVLEHYVLENPGKGVIVVGPLFHPDKYAFALDHDSPLTNRLTTELLGMQESGRITELRVKYLGEDG